MFFSIGRKTLKIVKLGIVTFLIFMVSSSYASGLYVGFPGAKGSQVLHCNWWKHIDETTFEERLTGIHYGKYVCVDYYYTNNDVGKVYIENLLSGNAPIPIEFDKEPAQSEWAPSMIGLNGHQYMAYKGAYNNRIYYGWSQDGRNWNGPYQVLNLTSQSTPQLQVFNGRVYLFYIRSDNAIVYTSTVDGASWTSVRRVGGGSRKPPTLTVYKGKMYITYRGKSSEFIYIQSTSDGVNWSSPSLISQKTSEAPSIAVHNNQLFIAFKGGTTENIYLIKSTNGVNWSAAWNPNQIWRTDKGPAIESYNNRLYLAFKGSGTDKVWYSSSANGINSWSQYIARPYTKTKGMLNLSVY